MTTLPKVEMSLFEAILSRRSVRQYQSRQISPQTVRILLEAAVRAPTAMHNEPWGFVVIQDKNVLKKLSDLSKPSFIEEIRSSVAENNHSLLERLQQPDFNIFYNAGTLILICGKLTAPLYDADCWLAAENLMLAACAMGLGTCVIGGALQALARADIKSELNIPDTYTVVAPIVLGYPNDQTSPVTRKKPFMLSSMQTT